MTLRTRNAILTLLSSISIFAALAFLVLLVSGFPADYFEKTGVSIALELLMAGLPLLIAFVSAIGFLRYFRKVTGPLIFFFFMAMVTLLGELAPALYHIFQHFELVPNARFVLTRLHLGALLLGFFCYFVTSVYMTGVKYQNQGTALFAAVAVSYAIALLIPLKTGDPSPAALFPVGFEAQLAAVLAIVLVLTLANFVRSAFANQNPEDAWIGIAVAVMMVGRWVLFRAADSAGVVVALVLLTLGAIYYSKTVFSTYLWH